MATIWGVGHNWSNPSVYQLCKSIDDGATWTDEGTVPSGMWVIEGIRCFHATDDDDMYLATLDNGVWHRSSGIWTQVLSAAGGTYYYSVWASAADDVWAVGGQPASSGVVRHWNGSIWENRDVASRAPLIGKGQTDTNYCVWASAPDDVWVVGSRSTPYLGQSVYVIHSDDGGATWTDRTPPGPTSYGFGIWGFGADDVWVCGQPGSGHAFVMHWTGSSWVDVADATLDATGASFGPITGRSSSDIWIASIVNWNPKLAHWDGAAWTIVTPDPAVRQWAALIQLAGDTDLWVGGIDPNDASNTMQSAQPPITSWTSRNNPLVSGTAGAGIIGLWAEPPPPPPPPPPAPIASWSFTITDYLPPFLRNEDPASGSFGNEIDTLISVDILDKGSQVNLSTIDAYVDGVPVFNGPGTFNYPFSGTISATSVDGYDGYDGYHLVLDSTENFLPSSLKSIRISARDFNGNHLDETYYFRIGVSAAVVASPYEITLDVNFSGDMSISPALRKTSNYQFDNGMYARLVDVVSPTQIRLWVELFHSVSPFSLTFSDEIVDTYGGGLVASSNPVSIVPFYSTADMTNFNGKVRTWRQSRIISADSQRIYLAGTRGIDVFRKQAESNPVRWGQVLDAYGINAMFVANFGGDLVITDTVPPFLTGQSPLPGGSTSASSPIIFTIQDLITAVEITSTTVYINNTLAFSGGINGWVNGYYGVIVVGHKTLSFEIYKDGSLPSGDGSVRVLATDLLGNSLDQTYTFTITVTLGFGSGGFGFIGFGGV